MKSNATSTEQIRPHNITVQASMLLSQPDGGTHLSSSRDVSVSPANSHTHARSHAVGETAVQGCLLHDRNAMLKPPRWTLPTPTCLTAHTHAARTRGTQDTYTCMHARSQADVAPTHAHGLGSTCALRGMRLLPACRVPTTTSNVNELLHQHHQHQPPWHTRTMTCERQPWVRTAGQLTVLRPDLIARHPLSIDDGCHASSRRPSHTPGDGLHSQRVMSDFSVRCSNVNGDTIIAQRDFAEEIHAPSWSLYSCCPSPTNGSQPHRHDHVGRLSGCFAVHVKRCRTVDCRDGKDSCTHHVHRRPQLAPSVPGEHAWCKRATSTTRNPTHSHP
jgi:hypothetical protein